MGDNSTLYALINNISLVVICSIQEFSFIKEAVLSSLYITFIIITKIYLLFPESRQRPEFELSQSLRRLCGIHFLTTLDQQKT